MLLPLARFNIVENIIILKQKELKQLNMHKQQHSNIYNIHINHHQSTYVPSIGLQTPTPSIHTLKEKRYRYWSKKENIHQKVLNISGLPLNKIHQNTKRLTEALKPTDTSEKSTPSVAWVSGTTLALAESSSDYSSPWLPLKLVDAHHYLVMSILRHDLCASPPPTSILHPNSATVLRLIHHIPHVIGKLPLKWWISYLRKG